MIIAVVKNDKEIKKEFLRKVLRQAPIRLRKNTFETITEKLTNSENLYISILFEKNNGDYYVNIKIVSKNNKKLIKSFKVSEIINNPKSSFLEIKNFLKELFNRYREYFNNYIDIDNEFNVIVGYITNKIKEKYNVEIDININDITENNNTNKNIVKQKRILSVTNPQKSKIITIDIVNNPNWDTNKILTVKSNIDGEIMEDDVQKIAYMNITWIKEILKVSELDALKLLNYGLNYHLPLPRVIAYLISERCEIINEIINTNTFVIKRNAKDFMIFLLIPSLILRNLEPVIKFDRAKNINEIYEKFEKYLFTRYKKLTGEMDYDINIESARLLKLMSELYIELSDYTDTKLKHLQIPEKFKNRVISLIEKHIPRFIKFISDKILVSA